MDPVSKRRRTDDIASTDNATESGPMQTALGAAFVSVAHGLLDGCAFDRSDRSSDGGGGGGGGGGAAAAAAAAAVAASASVATPGAPSAAAPSAAAPFRIRVKDPAGLAHAVCNLTELSTLGSLKHQLSDMLNISMDTHKILYVKVSALQVHAVKVLLGISINGANLDGWWVFFVS